MRFLFSILFILSFHLSWSQNDIKGGIFAGPDFSSLQPPSDSILTSPLVSPFFGAEIIYPIAEHHQISFGSSAFIKASKDNHQVKYKNYFGSLYADYSLNISENIFLSAGPQYSFLLSSTKINGSVRNTMLHYPSSYFSINAGIHLELQSHLNLAFIYEYPINNPKIDHWPSIKLKLSLLIDGDLLKKNDKKSNQEFSKQQVKTLKTTALLVRLRGYKKQIAIFEEQGDTAMVRLIKQKRDIQNLSLIEAFAFKFDFCPVYFFYNYDSRKIKNREFEGVFLNSNLQKDSTIRFELDTFLIGELGYAFEGVDENTVLDDKNTIRSRNNTTSDFSNYGFNIRNHDFYIIPKPFPNFVSGYFAIFKKSDKAIIERVNQELHKYYQTSSL